MTVVLVQFSSSCFPLSADMFIFVRLQVVQKLLLFLYPCLVESVLDLVFSLLLQSYVRAVLGPTRVILRSLLEGSKLHTDKICILIRL